MSDILDFLKQQAELPRDYTRETHPAIIDAVRDRVAAGEGKTVYDDEVERHVHAVAGDLPEYQPNGAENRSQIISQLGTECFIARRVIRDEDSAKRVAALEDEGFVAFDHLDVQAGQRFEVKFGKLYTGYKVPVYGETHIVKARIFDGKVALMKKGARTRGFDPALADACMMKAL